VKLPTTNEFHLELNLYFITIRYLILSILRDTDNTPASDRCTNLGEKILPIVLPSLIEAEKFSDHPHTIKQLTRRVKGIGYKLCMDRFFSFPDVCNSVTKQKVDSFSTFKLYHKVNAGLLQK